MIPIDEFRLHSSIPPLDPKLWDFQTGFSAAGATAAKEAKEVAAQVEHMT